MTKFKLAAIAIAAAGLATPALADSAYAPPTQRHVIHRGAVVAPAPALGYAYAPALGYASEPMVDYYQNTPAATGGGTVGYNQHLKTEAN